MKLETNTETRVVNSVSAENGTLDKCMFLRQTKKKKKMLYCVWTVKSSVTKQWITHIAHFLSRVGISCKGWGNSWKSCTGILNKICWQECEYVVICIEFSQGVSVFFSQMFRRKCTRVCREGLRDINALSSHKPDLASPGQQISGFTISSGKWQETQRWYKWSPSFV